jgi:DnaJ-class molecular chaperone
MRVKLILDLVACSLCKGTGWRFPRKKDLVTCPRCDGYGLDLGARVEP